MSLDGLQQHLMSYLKKMVLYLFIIKIYKKVAVEMFEVSRGLKLSI